MVLSIRRRRLVGRVQARDHEPIRHQGLGAVAKILGWRHYLWRLPVGIPVRQPLLLVEQLHVCDADRAVALLQQKQKKGPCRRALGSGAAPKLRASMVSQQTCEWHKVGGGNSELTGHKRMHARPCAEANTLTRETETMGWVGSSRRLRREDDARTWYTGAESWTHGSGKLGWLSVLGPRQQTGRVCGWRWMVVDGGAWRSASVKEPIHGWRVAPQQLLSITAKRSRWSRWSR